MLTASWHGFPTRFANDALAVFSVLLWLVAASYATFQKAIPIAGRVFIWLLTIPMLLFAVLVWSIRGIVH